MKNIFLIISISLFLVPNILNSNDNNNTYSLDLNSKYLKNYWYDTKYILTSPSKWMIDDYFIFGSILTSASCLYLYDEKLRDFFKDNQNKPANNITYVAEKFGNKYYISSFLVGSYFSGYLFDSKRLTETALLGFESLVISAIFTHSLKQLFHRHRPLANEGNDVFDGPFYSGNHDLLSFPSGHSTSSFAVATIFANQYAQNNLFLSSIIYSMATLTAISRVYDDEHWASDIFIGGIIGYLTGKTIYNLNQNRKNKISITPINNFKSKSYGLDLIYKF